MTEREFQSAVVALCHYLHVNVFHPYDSRKSEPGWPDLTIVGPRGVIFRELKTEVGRLTRPQIAWGTALHSAGADWALWRPRQLPTIADEITRLCGRGTA